ncbi:MAG: DUF2975 domain-containing protein [Clostridia bacterium]|nr:DUF2975 domain-containing protein [Clostridia bacterium]
MNKTKISLNISIGVCFAVSAVLFFLIFAGPQIFNLYFVDFRGFDAKGEFIKTIGKVFALCFYPSAIISAIILYSLLKLLFNIKNGKVFTEQNVKLLKTVSYGALVISVITFVSGIYFMPFLFISAAGIFTGILLRVLKNVMQSAILLKDENDLTV